MEVQIFGIQKERRNPEGSALLRRTPVKTHFVDLQERPASPGELRRFAQRFGVSALIDAGSRRYGELASAPRASATNDGSRSSPWSRYFCACLSFAPATADAG